MIVSINPNPAMNTEQPFGILACQPLTAHAFSLYGEVLDLFAPAQQTINQGTSGRLDLPAGLDLAGDQGQAAMAVFHALAQNPEGPCHMLERHQHGSQTFVPLTGARCRLLVALGQDQPDLRTLQCFDVTGQQGFTLHKGTWHHPLMALDKGAFLVLERRGLTVDCEIHSLPLSVRLSPL
jgi:ureidoglycolate lyase